MIGFVGENSVKTVKASNAFVEKLTHTLNSEYRDIPIRVLGPSPAKISKVNNKYRYKILLKCRNDSRFRSMLASVLKHFSKINEFSDVTVFADMHPLEL